MIFLAGLFGVADYFTGRDWKHLGWPLRSIYAVCPILMAALAAWGMMFSSWHLMWVGLGWGCYRSVLGWSSFGGSMDIQNRKQLIGELERNLLSVAFPILTLILIHRSPYGVIPAMFLFAAVATMIAVAYGYYVREEKIDIGPQTDIARGIAFGLILGVIV